MTKQIRNFICATLFMAILLVVPVVGAVEDGASSGSTSATTTEKETEAENEHPTAEELKVRIEARKIEFKIKLAAAEQTRLKAKCKAGQQVVKTIHDKIPQNVVNRDKAYKALTDRLDKLVAKLKVAGVDTTELEAEIVVLNTKITTYKTALTAYKQALTDLKSQDCTTDPDGFKAALENARAKRETLSKAVLDIRTYVKETIKPTLVTIRTTLEAKEKENSTTSTNEGTQ